MGGANGATRFRVAPFLFGNEAGAWSVKAALRAEESGFVEDGVALWDFLHIVGRRLVDVVVEPVGIKQMCVAAPVDKSIRAASAGLAGSGSSATCAL